MDFQPWEVAGIVNAAVAGSAQFIAGATLPVALAWALLLGATAAGTVYGVPILTAPKAAPPA